jgi:hypothetical protein
MSIWRIQVLFLRLIVYQCICNLGNDATILACLSLKLIVSILTQSPSTN